MELSFRIIQDVKYQDQSRVMVHVTARIAYCAKLYSFIYKTADTDNKLRVSARSFHISYFIR